MPPVQLEPDYDAVECPLTILNRSRTGLDLTSELLVDNPCDREGGLSDRDHQARAIAAQVREEVATRVSLLAAGVTPGLAVVLAETTQRVRSTFGTRSVWPAEWASMRERYAYPARARCQLQDTIAELNGDESIHGILFSFLYLHRLSRVSQRRYQHHRRG